VNAARRFALPFGAKRSRFPSAGTYLLSIYPTTHGHGAAWTTPAAPAQPSEELKPESAMGTRRNLQQDLDRSSHGGRWEEKNVTQPPTPTPAPARLILLVSIYSLGLLVLLFLGFLRTTHITENFHPLQKNQPKKFWCDHADQHAVANIVSHSLQNKDKRYFIFPRVRKSVKRRTEKMKCGNEKDTA
jgi:hypothetical protein